MNIVAVSLTQIERRIDHPLIGLEKVKAIELAQRRNRRNTPEGKEDRAEKPAMQYELDGQSAAAKTERGLNQLLTQLYPFRLVVFPAPFAVALAQFQQHARVLVHAANQLQQQPHPFLLRILELPLAQVPAQGMISKAYAGERASGIDMSRARCEVGPGDPRGFGKDTIYLSTIDRDGNIVSLIQSLYAGFGSGIVVDGFGVTLQNRGALYRLDPTHPDVLAPRKRPFHTIIPAFMERGNVHIGFGIMGGPNQAQAHAQYVSNIVDYGMNIQAALEAPRFTRPQPSGCHFLIEDRVPSAVLEALRERGHDLEVRGAYSTEMGGGQAVMRDSATGVNYGASDPRKDGAAVPEPDPYFPDSGRSSLK